MNFMNIIRYYIIHRKANNKKETKVTYIVTKSHIKGSYEPPYKKLRLT